MTLLHTDIDIDMGNTYHNCILHTLWPASVVQLVRTSYIMYVVMSSSPDWSETYLIFHITYKDYD